VLDTIVLARRKYRSSILLKRKKSLPPIVLLSLVLVLTVQPLHSASVNTSWSSSSLIDHFVASDNILPTALQASNGTIWLAWQSDRNGPGGRDDVVYKTLTGTTWSPVHNMTFSGENSGPALAQLLNGTIVLVWSANPTGTSCSPQCNLYYKMFRVTTQTWSRATQLSSGTFNDSLTSAAIARDGTLWLVWTRIVTSCAPSCTQTRQVFYRTLKNNVWSNETQLTSDSNWNWGTSVMVGKDSIVRVAFSKTPASQDGNQIYYKIYNGTWSTESQVVTSSTSDEHPSLMQDRNGTLWIFWARKIWYTSLLFYYVMFDKFSYDVGKTWSAEFQITNTSTSVDSKMPTAIQASTSVTKSIWVFYTSNLFYNNFDMYALTSSSIFPVHDVTITKISVSPGPGSSWIINVTVADLGDYSESVSVNLSMFNTTNYNLGNLPGSVLLGGTAKISFSWNTASVTPGLYSASASVTTPGETLGNQGDNSIQTNNLIQVLPLPPSIDGGGGGSRKVLV
jgi:hypothetical protein